MVTAGHEVVALASLRPDNTTSQEEDSIMYQTVGWHCGKMLAGAIWVPLYVETITGEGREMRKDYQTTEEDMVEDLYMWLERVDRETGVKVVGCGVFLGDYTEGEGGDRGLEVGADPPSLPQAEEPGGAVEEKCLEELKEVVLAAGQSFNPEAQFMGVNEVIQMEALKIMADAC